MIYNKTLSKRYQIVINTPSQTEREGLAGGVYAEAIQNTRNSGQITQNDLSGLEVKAKKIKIKWLVLIASLTVAVQGASTASAAKYSVDHLKLYAHSRLINWVEFQCFNKIITKESRWNYQSKNGSHHGLGQMRSQYYRELDPYRQIDSTIKYIAKRYQTPCNAWSFHLKNGYY